MNVKPLIWLKTEAGLFCEMGFAKGHIGKARKKGWYLFGLMSHYSEHPSIDAAKSHAQQMQNAMIAAAIFKGETENNANITA